MEIMNNIQHRSAARNPSGPQMQNWTETPNSRKRWFVPITLCLIFTYFLLVVTLILLYISNKTERDQIKGTCMNIVKEFNETLSSLKVNYSRLNDEREELQKNFTSVMQKKLELETELKKNFYKDKYFISTEEKSWTDSRRFCRDRGEDLVIINTEEEQRYIYAIIKGNTWIGLSDMDNKGIMKWVDDSTPNETFWSYHNTYGTKNWNCVQLMLYSYSPLRNWENQRCTEKKLWICEN